MPGQAHVNFEVGSASRPDPLTPESRIDPQILFGRPFEPAKNLRDCLEHAKELRNARAMKLAQWRNDVEMTCRKALPKMDISDDLNQQINESITISDLCKADVVRQALRIGLPRLAARFRPAPVWLEERIREAPAEVA